VIKTSKSYTCEATRTNECNFTLWKEDKFFKTFCKNLTVTIAKEFLKDRKAKVKGLKSTKKEGTFEAVISIKKNVEKNRWEYDLAFDNSKSKKMNIKL
jgi:DNA topoisomerase-3